MTDRDADASPGPAAKPVGSAAKSVARNAVKDTSKNASKESSKGDKGDVGKGHVGKSNSGKSNREGARARPDWTQTAPPEGAVPKGGAAHPPVAIKKYANRRLYNTGTSTYVTLDDLARMVRRGEDFTVTDARSQEDITRSVLAQIIFEQEAKGEAAGANLLPLSVMRQLIRFYGDSMQHMVPKYLEYSMDAFDRDQDKFRDMGFSMGEAMTGALGKGTLTVIEERSRRNVEMFAKAMQVFNPFAAMQAQAAQAQATAQAATQAAPEAEPEPVLEEDDLSALKRQMREMQERLEKLSK